MEYVLQTYWLIWLIIGGVFLIGEIITTGFILFMPGVAALLTAIAAVCNVGFGWQICIFCLSSILLLAFMKPILCRAFVHDRADKDDFSIVGKTGYVTEDIDNVTNRGLVNISGDVWSAVSDCGVIKAQTPVRVVEIVGVKAKVEEIKMED